MDDLMHYFSTHPLAIMALVFAVLLVAYFLFKQLIKMALLLVIVLLALGGYFHFKYPGHTWEHMKDTLQKARTGAGGMVEKGKEAYQAAAKLFKEAKELPGYMKKALDNDMEDEK
jgi:hypothetical protein